MRRSGVAVLRTEPWGNLARGRGKGFWIWDSGPGRGSENHFQVVPPSTVVKRRPSTAVTVAVRASVAWIAARSTATGNIRRCHCLPSVVSSTVPARPTTQHTSPDGDAPAVRSVPTPVGVASHLAPASSEYPRRPQARCANGLRRQARRSPSPAGPKSRPRVSRRAGLSGRESSRERPAAPLEPRCPRREKHCPAALRFHPVARLSLQRFHPRARLSLPPPHAGIPALLARATAHRLPQQTVDRQVP